MKRYIVTYTVISTRCAEVEADSKESAYDFCAQGFPMNETEVDSEYGDDISCEEVSGDKN
jgi:hypothetical protein